MPHDITATTYELFSHFIADGEKEKEIIGHPENDVM